VNPNIAIYQALFDSVTLTGVKEAIIVEYEKHLSDAVKVRQQLDLRVSAAFTKL
jgi:hypothetical protein